MPNFKIYYFYFEVSLQNTLIDFEMLTPKVCEKYNSL